MRRWIVIPVKAPEACKTRLMPALGDAERQALVAAMLRQTVDAAMRVVGEEAVLLLGPSRHGLADNLVLIDDPGGGLNAALTHARDRAVSAGVERLLLLSADLPTVEAEDIAALLDMPETVVAAGPDRAGQGTNALSLPLPQGAAFRFHYGDGSFAAHRKEADRLKLGFVAVERPGLALDIDRPDEVALWPRN